MAASWLWDFGDNNTSVDENPVHVYAADGQYTVTLTAIDTTGAVTLVKTFYVVVVGTVAGLVESMEDAGGYLVPTEFLSGQDPRSLNILYPKSDNWGVLGGSSGASEQDTERLARARRRRRLLLMLASALDDDPLEML